MRSGARRRLLGRASGGCVALLLAALSALPGDVQAQMAFVPPKDMSVVITPAISTNSGALPWGWSPVVISISNSSASPTRGEVRASLKQYGNKRSFEAQAPYVVPAGGTVSVKLPVDVIAYAEVDVVVVDVARGMIADTHFSALDSSNVVLLDTARSQLRGAIHETPVVPAYQLPSHGSRGSGAPASALSVAISPVDNATGDPILPDRAALYDAADAVLFRSDMLARLSGPELEALAGFVLAGGTLAIAITRPEDVRHPTITALVGGEVVQTAVSSDALRQFALPVPSSADRDVPHGLAPGEEVGVALAGFHGGNLRGSRYGNSASYGLGEVHLLAFDPTKKPALDDPWVKVRMIDLARRAFDRRGTIVFRPGEQEDGGGLQKVRKLLDPNESSRWAIAAAALLLLVYAVLAGPVNYSIAARRNKPLSALRLLPLFSVITFLLIVGIGMVAKGTTGRARHLSLVEAGAGMSKGSVRRYRGFFASRAGELTVRTTDTSSVIRTALVSEPGEAEDHLVVDREGARLENVNALPWQTLVMREDGIAALGDGIVIAKKDPGAAVVKNRSGHDLRGVLLRLPGGEVRYFSKLADGDTVESSTGREVGTSPKDRAWIAAIGTTSMVGVMPIRPLRSYAITPVLEDDAPGLADAWQAIEEATRRDAGWFVDDVPVLLAQMDGGEGRTSDSGLRLESDRVLVRVVGYGGAL